MQLNWLLWPHSLGQSHGQRWGPGRVFRIATMDCSAEEAEIRRALEPVDGIRSLGFQLGARTLSIDAIESVYPLALAAIRNAGFDPKPVTSKADSHVAPLGGHAEGDEHAHGISGGISRLVVALVCATGAELLSFFAPDQTPWKVAGLVIAGLAIWLAGLDTYKKGVAALVRGKLNINALMSVAVTGAFLIGQEAVPGAAVNAIAQKIRVGPGPR